MGGRRFGGRAQEWGGEWGAGGKRGDATAVSCVG